MFAVYCASLVAFLAYANYQGYVLNNLFDGQAHVNKSANHYHK
jgi:hypothetical protein